MKLQNLILFVLPLLASASPLTEVWKRAGSEAQLPTLTFLFDVTLYVGQALPPIPLALGGFQLSASICCPDFLSTACPSFPLGSVPSSPLNSNTFHSRTTHERHRRRASAQWHSVLGHRHSDNRPQRNTPIPCHQRLWQVAR